MPKKRSPRYDVSFKRRAAEQVLTRNRPIAQVARQMGCSVQAVRNWIDHQEILLQYLGLKIPRQFKIIILKPM